MDRLEITRPEWGDPSSPKADAGWWRAVTYLGAALGYMGVFVNLASLAYAPAIARMATTYAVVPSTLKVVLVRLFAAAFSYGVVLTEYEYVQLLDAFDVLRFWPARSCLYFMLGLLTFEPKKHVWLYWPQTAVACGLMVLALLYGALAVHVEVGGEFVAWLLRAQNLVRRPSRPLSGLG